jgi:micrococcal nuclease
VATVTHVVDGDTVDLQIAGTTERVRLLGIDTPETVKPDTPVQCFGPEASARTKALLPDGTAVLVQRDAEARDRYGRLLGYVWRRADGRFVNADLVSGGYARILSITPNTAHRAELARLAGEARTAGRGLWASCPPVDRGTGP